MTFTQQTFLAKNV